MLTAKIVGAAFYFACAMPTESNKTTSAFRALPRCPRRPGWAPCSQKIADDDWNAEIEHDQLQFTRGLFLRIGRKAGAEDTAPPKFLKFSAAIRLKLADRKSDLEIKTWQPRVQGHVDESLKLVRHGKNEAFEAVNSLLAIARLVTARKLFCAAVTLSPAKLLRKFLL